MLIISNIIRFGPSSILNIFEQLSSSANGRTSYTVIFMSDMDHDIERICRVKEFQYPLRAPYRFADNKTSSRGNP